MKKLTAFALLLSIVLTLFCGCGDTVSSSTPDSVAPKTQVRIAGMKGPTSIGLVNILENNSNGTALNNYRFTLAGAADEITPKLIRGELDMAAVPANLASVLYNKTEGEIQVLAINTLGVLYIVTKGETVATLQDLKGKTIYATGKGTTPEHTLRYLLTQNGINPDTDVNIEFKNEATEVVSAISAAETAIAMLPQPYVTVAQNKVSGLQIAIDLNTEWERLNPNSGIVTGVLVVRKSFADANPHAVNLFLQEYKQSVEFVNQNNALAAALVAKHGVFDNQKVIEKAIPHCNITFISGNDIISPINKYLGVLYEQESKSVGGKLPNEDFFRIQE